MTQFRTTPLREPTFVKTSFKACRLLPKWFSVSIAAFVYDILGKFELFGERMSFVMIFDRRGFELLWTFFGGLGDICLSFEVH